MATKIGYINDNLKCTQITSVNSMSSDESFSDLKRRIESLLTYLSQERDRFLMQQEDAAVRREKLRIAWENEVELTEALTENLEQAELREVQLDTEITELTKELNNALQLVANLEENLENYKKDGFDKLMNSDEDHEKKDLKLQIGEMESTILELQMELTNALEKVEIFEQENNEFTDEGDGRKESIFESLPAMTQNSTEDIFQIKKQLQDSIQREAELEEEISALSEELSEALEKVVKLEGKNA